MTLRHAVAVLCALLLGSALTACSTEDQGGNTDPSLTDAVAAPPTGVCRELTPEDVAGTHKTLAGDEITVEGSGEDFTVGDAKVVCGNVQTSNATVYIIDGVLMPEMKK